MQPLFTIIIPTYNRPKPLHILLQALTELIPPKGGFEVIVVDDGSSETMESVVDPFRDKLNIRLLRQSNSGPAEARNHGARVATTRYLAFTDDDCIPDPQWLVAAAAHLESHPDVMVGGKIINHLIDNPFSETSQLIVDMVYEHYNAQPHNARFFCSDNMIVPREHFEVLAGFDAEHFGYVSEDRDLCDRWLQAGFELHYVPEAVIFHAHDLTLKKFLRQHFHYGQGAYLFYQVRERVAARANLSMHTSAGPWHLVSQKAENRRQLLQLSALLGLWQIANLAGYVHARFFRGDGRQTG